MEISPLHQQDVFTTKKSDLLVSKSLRITKVIWSTIFVLNFIRIHPIVFPDIYIKIKAVKWLTNRPTNIIITSLEPCHKLRPIEGWYTASTYSELTGRPDKHRPRSSVQSKISALAVEVEQLIRTQWVNGDLMCLQSRQIIDNRRQK